MFVTSLAEFLVEIAIGLGLLDCDCSGSEDNTALGGMEETAQKLPLLKAVQYQKFNGDMFHVVCESMFILSVQRTEVLCEEISFC